MRPRHKAAENDLQLGLCHAAMPASMRPRHKAAENALHLFGILLRVWCFNEAAA